MEIEDIIRRLTVDFSLVLKVVCRHRKQSPEKYLHFGVVRVCCRIEHNTRVDVGETSVANCRGAIKVATERDGVVHRQNIMRGVGPHQTERTS